MNMRVPRSVVTVLTAVTLVTASVVAAQPAAAAGCSGALTAQLGIAVASGTRGTPPTGFDFATQPEADLTAGGTVFGAVNALRDQACTVAGASVTLAARQVGQSSYNTRRTGTTNANGYFEFQVKPTRTTDLRATVAVADERATSNVRRQTVRPLVRATFESSGGCAVVTSGSTYPAKPNHPVWLQRRITSGGVEKGYVTLAKGVAAADGSFRVDYTAPCGADYALATYVPPSATNTAGRSVYVDLHVLARR